MLPYPNPPNLNNGLIIFLLRVSYSNHHLIFKLDGTFQRPFFKTYISQFCQI